MNDQLPPEREQRGPPPRQAQYRREAQDRGMRRRRQQFLNQAMRQGIGFEGEEKDDDGFRRLPQGRDAVRRRRNQRGLPPRNQRGRGFFSSPEEMVDRLVLAMNTNIYNIYIHTSIILL